MKYVTKIILLNDNSEEYFFVALINSIEEKFHAHLFAHAASSELVVLLVLSGFGGLVAHCSLFPDSFF